MMFVDPACGLEGVAEVSLLGYGMNWLSDWFRGKSCSAYMVVVTIAYMVVVTI